MTRKFFWVLNGLILVFTVVLIVVAVTNRYRAAKEVATATPLNPTTETPVNSAPETPIPTPVVPTPATPSKSSDDDDSGTGMGGMVDTPVHRITINGSNFKFDPSEVRIKKGEVVRIRLVNAQGTHNIFVAGYDMRTAVKGTGGEDSIEFTADKTGTFDMWCEVGAHKANGMVGKLIVE